MEFWNKKFQFWREGGAGGTKSSKILEQKVPRNIDFWNKKFLLIYIIDK